MIEACWRIKGILDVFIITMAYYALRTLSTTIVPANAPLQAGLAEHLWDSAGFLKESAMRIVPLETLAALNKTGVRQ
jgi:hypothetical protein